MPLLQVPPLAWGNHRWGTRQQAYTTSEQNVQYASMIYLDYNATAPIAPEVLEAMMPYLTTEWGNPSSSYAFGSKLKAVIEKARRQVAELIGASPREIIFTSCATESNNTAIHAAIKANPAKRHIVTSAVEHSSVLAYCKALENECYRVTYLPVDREGLLKLTDLEDAITEETAVVSLMWANNGLLSRICGRLPAQVDGPRRDIGLFPPLSTGDSRRLF